MYIWKQITNTTMRTPSARVEVAGLVSPHHIKNIRRHDSLKCKVVNNNRSGWWLSPSTGFRAGAMGIGFTSDDDVKPVLNESKVVMPEYGLSVQQMHVLGLSSEAMTKLPEVEAVSALVAPILWSGCP